MDLGVTTFFFLILNCFLLFLGVFRILIAIAIAIMSVFVFSHLKEVTFSPYISDAILAGMNEEAIFILGILAGNKNNVRFLNTYQVFILLLIATKICSIFELNRNESRLKFDMDLALSDVMNEQRNKSMQPSKADDIQRFFHCCGIEDYHFWLQGSNKTELPPSCCRPRVQMPCDSSKVWPEGCLKMMQSKVPLYLFNIHYYTMFPICEVVLFVVGIALIVMVMRTAANSLA